MKQIDWHQSQAINQLSPDLPDEPTNGDPRVDNLDHELAKEMEKDTDMIPTQPAQPAPMPSFEARQPVHLRPAREPDIGNIMTSVQGLYEKIEQQRIDDEREWQDQRMRLMREHQDTMRKLDAEHYRKDNELVEKLGKIVAATRRIAHS